MPANGWSAPVSEMLRPARGRRATAGRESRGALFEGGCRDRIMRRAVRGAAAAGIGEAFQPAVSKRRFRGGRCFGTVKRLLGLSRASCFGQEKAHGRMVTVAVRRNLLNAADMVATAPKAVATARALAGKARGRPRKGRGGGCSSSVIHLISPSASLKCNPGPPPERGRSPGGPGGPGLKDFPARGPDSAWNAAAVPSDPGVSGPSAGRKAPRRDRPGKGGRSPTEPRTVPPVCSFPPTSRQVQAPQGGCARPIASAGVR